MTREELKEHCERQIQQFERVEQIMPVTLNDCKRYEEHKLILELLEQEPILEKIRVEIKAMFPPSGTWMYEEGHEVEHTVCEVLSDVLKIIDKYRGE